MFPTRNINKTYKLAAVDFFNQVNLLYGTLAEFCTPENCPTMTAGPKYAFPIIPIQFPRFYLNK